MKFADYHISHEIKKSIAKLGFKKPTDIQYKSIPPILKGDDVLAIAQTGTGKTAAFAIPIIDILHKRKQKGRPNGIKCVVMVPTRELALQLTEVFNSLEKHTRVKTFSIYGGVEEEEQIARLQKGFDIMVATPGRMFDLVSRKFIDLHRIEILVLDEADHMLDLGFIKDIRDLIKFLPKKRQTLFFSATIDKKIKELAYSLVSKPVRIEISPKDPVSKNVEHAVSFIEPDDKRFFLERVIRNSPESKILVFVRTKVRAERVVKAMERVGIAAESLHGDKDQKERFRTMDKFRTGELKILIATDVSARGIDIPNVEYVVNYDLPEQTENYVHRVGRTGRGKEKGQAISFCSNEEKETLEKIEAYLTKPIYRIEIDKNDYQETIDFMGEEESDWLSLIKEEEDNEVIRKQIKRKAMRKKLKKKKK